MRPPSEDIKDLLDGESTLGLTFATDLFVSDMPATPDFAVCVYDSGGLPAESGYVYERPTVQVRVRGAKGGYIQAFETAQSIHDFLIRLWQGGQGAMTVGGARYVGIWPMAAPQFVGYDENHRPQVTVNFRLHRTTTG